MLRARIVEMSYQRVGPATEKVTWRSPLKPNLSSRPSSLNPLNLFEIQSTRSVAGQRLRVRRPAQLRHSISPNLRLGNNDDIGLPYHNHPVSMICRVLRSPPISHSFDCDVGPFTQPVPGNFSLKSTCLSAMRTYESLNHLHMRYGHNKRTAGSSTGLSQH